MPGSSREPAGAPKMTEPTASTAITRRAGKRSRSRREQPRMLPVVLTAAKRYPGGSTSCSLSSAPVPW
jgi:hypothetical protein